MHLLGGDTLAEKFYLQHRGTIIYAKVVNRSWSWLDHILKVDHSSFSIFGFEELYFFIM